MNGHRTQIILAASLVLAAIFVFEGVVDAAPRASVEGYLYGTVETKAGKLHTGILRWDDEEAFWDDLFHSVKEELPYEEYAEPPEVKDDLKWWEKMARTIGDEVGVQRETRVVAVRFGDLKSVRPARRDGAVLTLRDGTEIEVDGYANDVKATVVVFDTKPGKVEVRWNQIEEIRFAPTPPDADPGSFRLRGTVATEEGDFVGFIQWDSQEALSTDRLDGDDDDRRVSVPMGEIRSIEKISRRSSLGVMKDGVEYRLSGTNDVNDDIRGIHVEDERFGRVEVSWGAFEKVVFEDPGASGSSYGDYGAGTPLTGTVTLTNGDWRKGRLVFDLDEEWSWEMLDGSSEELDYAIPFARVASIEPRGDDGSLVILRNGRRFELESGHDVGENNSGVVVIPTQDGEPGFVPWREVAKIEFE